MIYIIKSIWRWIVSRIASKTNWNATDRPLAPDFNRIESNNDQAFSEIDAEEQARVVAINAEASARQSAINAEASARTSAINAEASARTSAINAEASARIAGDNSLNAIKVNNTSMGPRTLTEGVTNILNIPAGVHYTYIQSNLDFTTNPRLEVRDGPGTWRDFGTLNQRSRLLISDGTNIRVIKDTGNFLYRLIKIS
jgi:hypothetical protein